MGSELRRMIRDGAPASWTPLMRIVAEEIADDARDPDPTGMEGGIGGWPWSTLPITGHWDARRGRWRPGLAERCGRSGRAISRALTELARAGYEMREPIGQSNDGRPVFAARGHAMRFRVPPLQPRPVPDSPPIVATFEPDSPPVLADSPPVLADSPPVLVTKVAEFGDPVSSVSYSDPLNGHLKSGGPVVTASVEGNGAAPAAVDNRYSSTPDTTTPEGTELARQAAHDALAEWERQQDGRAACPRCGQRVKVASNGFLWSHGPRDPQSGDWPCHRARAPTGAAP